MAPAARMTVNDGAYPEVMARAYELSDHLRGGHLRGGQGGDRV